MKRNLYWLPVALAFLIGMAAAGCSNKQKPEETASEAVIADTHEEESGERETESKTAEETRSYPAGSREDDYILPEAQNHIYTQEELSDLTREELRIARNEIYARHGRKFKSDDLNSYFSGKSWYQPSVDGDTFDDSVLNESETGNLAAVKAAEENAPSELVTCPKIGKEDFPRIDGSTATIPLSQAIYRLAADATEREAERLIRHDKTTQAYLKLIRDQGTDLVIAYEPGESVKKRLKEEGDNLIIKPIGRDALVFMANQGNPVNSLTGRQVIDIYSGNITNWKTVGGSSQAIRAFQRPVDSGSQNLMEKLVMKGTAMAEAPQDFVVSEMGELIEKVSAYDNTGEALGYSVYYYAKNMYQKPELKFMAVDGVMPSSDTIRDGSYPYVSDFYAAVRKDEPKDSNAYRLFEWLTSDDGQALINALGYVGVRDEKKLLPQGFEGEDEVFQAEIPLSKGEVILADGDYLYGENGIAVFDRSMNLMKFIRHVESQAISPFLVWDGSGLLSMQDTLTGNYGLYFVAEERWVCEPVYSDIYQTKDGYGLEHAVWVESGRSGEWHYTYDYADKNGAITEKGVQSDRKIWGEEGSEELYYDVKEFMEHYPEIAMGLEVTSEAVSIYGTEFQENIAVIEKENRNYYYNMRGKCLFEFDKSGLPAGKEQMMFPIIVNDHVAFLSVYDPDGTDVSRDYIYRDGTLVKTLESGSTSGNVSDIEEDFYTRTAGNYLYVYNYQDEPCAKFLMGYYTSD